MEPNSYNINSIHRFPYEWNLKDAIFTKDKGKVFSSFACGGGSTMGYKLAGFDVIGCNEIDPKMMEVYKINHNPKYSYLEPIQTFKLRKDLPEELYNLDILDGSPPCSSFSTSGNREKDWGVEKKFKEGQSKQVLDTLFFDFIDLAKELQPKIVKAENVKGLIQGEAQKYVRKIYTEFQKAGYQLRIAPYLLDASKMGVPQRRERVFFIALRNDLADQFMEQVDFFQKAPKLDLDFNEEEIIFREIKNNLPRKKLTNYQIEYWEWCIANKKTDFGAFATKKFGKRKNFSHSIQYDWDVCFTIMGNCNLCIEDEPAYLNNDEIIKVSSFPNDYNFNNNKVDYVTGMSVPPIMTAQIATKIHEQWLSKIEQTAQIRMEI